MAPTAPYATTTQVAFLMSNLLKGGLDFTDNTTPTNAAVTQVISWVSAAVEMQFSKAGYVLPFAVIGTETWITSQTTYLAFLTAIGSAAYVGGHILKPAPAVGPGRTGAVGNIYQNLFDKEMLGIYNEQFKTTSLRFRANFYLGTPAEHVVTQPEGPTSDWVEGYADPMRWLNMWDMTEKMRVIEGAIHDLGLPFDYMYDVFDIDRGMGEFVEEGTG